MKTADNEIRMLTRVKISAEGLDTCIGRIEDVRALADMPDLPETGMPTEGELAPRNILAEWGVTRVAMISYHNYPGQEVMFAAIEIGGKWFDLRRQELTLEVVGQYEWPRQFAV